MSDRTLPHDPYITAVETALTAAGIKPVHSWTSASETIGCWCHLTGVITLDPSGTYDVDFDDLPANAEWPSGLLVTWEWHTGLEEGGPERGATWEWAQLNADGSNCPAKVLAADYASPADVVAAVQAVISGTEAPAPTGTWEQAPELAAAVATWGATEEASGETGGAS